VPWVLWKLVVPFLTLGAISRQKTALIVELGVYLLLRGFIRHIVTYMNRIWNRDHSLFWVLSLALHEMEVILSLEKPLVTTEVRCGLTGSQVASP